MRGICVMNSCPEKRLVSLSYLLDQSVYFLINGPFRNARGSISLQQHPKVIRRAVRRTVYGIRPYADGYYTAAFPAVPRTVLERYRGSYGTVRYRITAVLRLYGRRILRLQGILPSVGFCGVGVDLKTQMSTPVCWGVRDATIPCSVADNGLASAIWAEEDATILSATIEGPCEVDQSQELTCKKVQ
jgi:hypothetical protein